MGQSSEAWTARHNANLQELVRVYWYDLCQTMRWGRVMWNRVSTHVLWRMTTAIGGAFVVVVVATGPAAAQQRPDFLFGQPGHSIAIRGQWKQARAEGGVYDFVTDELTLEKNAFNAPGIALDVGFTLTPRVELRTGIDFSSAFARSEFREFTDTEGLPVEQDTRLRQVDIVGSMAFAIMPRGRAIGQYSYIPNPVVPYVGGGGGFLRYQFEQIGDFVDFSDLAIFGARLESSAWTLSAHAFSGVDIRLTPNLFITGEARYVWADAELQRDFSRFDPIDLTGLRIGTGVRFVF